MNSLRTFSAIPPKAKLAFYTAIVFAMLLVLVGNGYAATPSDASLKGNYFFHLTTPKQAYWSASKTCGSGTKKYTAFVSGSTVYTQLIRGTITFDGKGGITAISFSNVNQFNQTATNALIRITCDTSTSSWTSNNVQPVFESAVTGAGKGTYSVQSTGSGSMVLDVHDTGSTESEAVTLDFDLGGAESNAIAPSALVRSPDADTGDGFTTGAVVHQ